MLRYPMLRVLIALGAILGCARVATAAGPCPVGEYFDGASCLACTTGGGTGIFRVEGVADSCPVCTGCGGGTYASLACTCTSDTVGWSCATCGAGSYPAAACTPVSNPVCGSCAASCATCSGGAPTQCTSC